MLSAGHVSSIVCRTTLSTAPRLMPGDACSFSNITSTSTLSRVSVPKRRKSTWMGRSVTGSCCTSRASTRCVWPFTETSNTWEKKPVLAR